MNRVGIPVTGLRLALGAMVGVPVCVGVRVGVALGVAAALDAGGLREAAGWPAWPSASTAVGPRARRAAAARCVQWLLAGPGR